MTHKNLNLAFAVYSGRALPVVKGGDIITQSNLAQMESGTVLFDGVKNLIFDDCNLVNVAIDPSWTVTGCNTFQGDYDPAEIFPDESVAVLQGQKDAIRQQILDDYAATIDAQMQDMSADDMAAIDTASFEASVLSVATDQVNTKISMQPSPVKRMEG
jgi:hypothetical protein